MTGDKLLIQKVKDGDTNAFRQLVQTHHKRVIHICLSFVTIPQDAEDIAQNVFIEAYKSIYSFRGDASISTWLYRLSVNKSLDFIREKKRLKRGNGLVTSVDKTDLENIQVTNSKMADDDLIRQEQIRMLEQAIDQLPERQKVAFQLSKIDGMSQQEVADTMNTSVSSVESLLIRAKRKLKELLIHKKEEIY